MLRHIVFDMGGVLIRFDTELFLRNEGVTGEDAALLKRELYRSLEWIRMDRGTMTDAEAAESVCRRVPEHLHGAVGNLCALRARPILPLEGMEALVRELKARGYGIYLLTNANVRQRDYWPRVPASECFDGTLISSDVKLMKPEAEIYRVFGETFALPLNECLFIDDSPQNCEGAERAGMTAVVFHGDTALLRRELIALGLRLDP